MLDLGLAYRTKGEKDNLWISCSEGNRIFLQMMFFFLLVLHLGSVQLQRCYMQFAYHL